MTLIDLLFLLLVAGLLGAVARALGGGTRGGCLVSIAVGFVGALLGVALARWSGFGDLFVISVGGTRFPIVWSVIGGALFVAALNLIRRG
jgi:uncharacterized membrane protein YeaQ/YmgE (transglycosylase-associated protein family)